MTFSLCANCGNDAVQETTVPYLVEHNGKSKSIEDVRMRCPACENLSYQGDQISRHERAVAGAIRELEGLLSPDELYRIRSKYRLKQSDMEHMLSTGPKTWTRWERGKVPHSKSADKLIRLIAESPEVARRLMEDAGVVNAEATAMFDQIDRDVSRIARAGLKQDLGADEVMTASAFVERFYDHALERMKQAREQAICDSEAA